MMIMAKSADRTRDTSSTKRAKCLVKVSGNISFAAAKTSVLHAKVSNHFHLSVGQLFSKYTAESILFVG